MSTFPQKCHDAEQTPHHEAYAAIRDNTNQLNSVMMDIVRHVNSELNANQIDLNAMEGKLKKHVSAEIRANKSEFARLADSLMETILHGVADVSVTGNCLDRDISAAMESVPDVVQDEEPQETSAEQGRQYNPPEPPGQQQPERIIPGLRPEAERRPTDSIPQPITVSEGVNVVRVTGLDGIATALITINIVVQPAPVRVISERTPFAYTPQPGERFAEAPPTGGSEQGSFNPEMYGDTSDDESLPKDTGSDEASALLESDW